MAKKSPLPGIPPIAKKVLGLAVRIQQIPSPTFAEGARAEFVRQWFLTENLSDVSTDELGNVYARIPGAGAAPPLVVSAHLDTVFPASTPLDLRREVGRIQAPGIGDNSLGVAGLFGLLWTWQEKIQSRRASFPGDVWLVANVGEEGLGDLRGMRRVVERFRDQVTAYLVLEGMALGAVYHRALGVQRFSITVHTRGGHSWVDYGKPSAVHELAGLVTRLSELPISEKPRSTLNVGVISGGVSVNTIAPQARLELDLRSESASLLDQMARQVEALVYSIERPGVQAALEVIGRRPAGEIPGDHPLVRWAVECLEAQGLTPSLTIGSTDANIPLSLGLPAVCLGLSTGGGAHTVDEYINIPPLEAGLAQVFKFTEGVFLIRN